MTTFSDETPSLLTLRGVRRRLGGPQDTFLLDVNRFAVWQSEFVLLTGESGCGKTTFLHVLALILKPDEAEVFAFRPRGVGPSRDRTYDLARLYAQGRRSEIDACRRRHVGIATQLPHLLPSLTVCENVEAPVRLNGQGSAHDRVRGLLASFGCAELADRRDGLSGGQARRVGLARAVAHRPALLLADEPTNDLDKATAVRLLDALDRMRRQEGLTIVMVTHDLGLVSRYASRTVYLAKDASGRATIAGEEPADGPPEPVPPRPRHC
jgi:putative ABC transport system ATP-binding protein